MKPHKIVKITFIACILILSLFALTLLIHYVIQEAEYIQFDDSIEGTRILFIGNSYTYENNLPKIFRDLAIAGGHEVHVAMVVQGGWNLNHHYRGVATKIIKQGMWDFVVLQEQSVIPSIQIMRERQMYPAIRALNTEIENAGAKTILFMTWGHRDGAAILGSHDYNEMQSRIIDGYDDIGKELDLLVSPVGKAWLNVLGKDPKTDLWGTDGSHPNIKGSYLSACVFYAVIFQESPEGLPFMVGLPEDVGFFLQQVANDTVIDRQKGKTQDNHNR